ncbi:phosphohydrolase [Candidatus Tenderia electrophaga]|uniref:Phosphohydrolase n=1 Tax=Candidatus Tenderia electrophaga TaxID=1748243 RepID=A0A0S2TCS3_9GAMM|nr:phosphohydrolase [Candidatus Tenderia electrophaga]
MKKHKDILAALNQDIPLNEKLVHAHKVVTHYFPYVARIAITLYDPKTGALNAYLHSGEASSLPGHEHGYLQDVPNLQALITDGQPNVISNTVTQEEENSTHRPRIGRHGYAASYTMPMFNKGALLGFIFFNSHEPDVFAPEDMNHLDIFGHLLSLMVINELSNIKTLAAALKTTGEITHLRDSETGSHLDRMSRYAKLIAAELSESHHLDDDFIEHIFLFSPLHDIGKIGIPDNILLKNGKLTDEEKLIMQTHVKKGREIIDSLLANFGLETIEHVDMLRNIAEFHHEAINGQGYLREHKGADIPLEARIVAVADVFDALTSRRPYKEAWSNDAAFAWLKQVAGIQLDSDCVNALIKNEDEIEKIQRRFKEDIYGT